MLGSAWGQVEALRMDTSWYSPATVHPASLVDAIREVAGRHPDKWDVGQDRLVARVAIELGCTWQELRDVEDLTTGLNSTYTAGAPLRFEGLALEYWSLLDDLSAQGWTWDTIARAVASMYNNHLSEAPF